MIRPIPGLFARLATALTVAAASIVPAARAAEPDAKNTVALTPEEADADYAVQGEYAGALETSDGERRFGVQVVALGGGKFNAVAYRGGLPGDGWDGSEKLEHAGRTSDGAAVFERASGRGVIRDGVLILENDAGEEVARFKKVHRTSPTLEKKPPEGAVVLFDGSSVDSFPGARMTEDGLLVEGATSGPRFRDFTLHLEFLLSYMPHARGQGRSNSGCYLQGRYEVQILDSFGLKGEHNECGGIYSVKAPDVNMCFPPLAWQTYDVDFTAARFNEGGEKTANARMTVRHNGVLIHDDVEAPHATTASPLQEGPEPGPIFLQNHGNPLRFRNIWVVEKN